jgi:hypothetical protein
LILSETVPQGISEIHLNTLRALKCLKEHFKDDQTKWKLVALKAKKFLVKELSLSSTKEVDEIVSKFDIKFII